VRYEDDISVMGVSVQVWLDGRPSRMDGNQLKSFLASMQGSEIDRIEVITNPSSRYQAEGLGGIIDIRTKKGLNYGLNGSITAGYRQGRTDRENLGINMNWRREKVNLFGTYTAYRTTNWEKIVQTNIMKTPTDTVTFAQETITKTTEGNLSNQYRVGLDYFPNSKSILGFIISGHFGSPGNTHSVGINNISPIFDSISQSKLDNYRSNKNNGIQTNINYQTMFSKPRQQLNIDIDYAGFNYNPIQDITNKYFAEVDAITPSKTEYLNSANDIKFDVYSEKIDYMQNLLKDARMENGIQFVYSIADNNLVYKRNNILDINITNHFMYYEMVNAVYTNISQQLGKFSIQVGLRGEHTYSRGNQLMTPTNVSDTTYFDIFPTFFANYRLSQVHNFGISYSRRLSRPNYIYLNPFEIILDAYSFTRGNPTLKPAYTHNIHFSYMFGQTLMTRLAYSNTKDMIMRIPIEERNNNSYRYGTTYDNFGKSQNIAILANYRKTMFKYWNMNLTTQCAYIVNSSKSLTSSNEFVNKGISIIAQINNNFPITTRTAIEANAQYVSVMRRTYFDIKPQGNFTVSVRQMLLNNRMALSLTMNDIFYTSKDRMTAKYDDLDYSLNYFRDSRNVNLTIRYNFGSNTVRTSRNKATGIEDELSRASGG
jgi:hypothetical protein